MEKLNLWLKYNSMAYRRRARAPMRRRKPALRRKYGGIRRVRRIANKVTVIKRLAEPVRLASDTNGGFSVIDSGSGCILFNGGTANSGTIPGTAQGGGALTFALVQCLQSTDITQLFDRYRISGVKLDFLFQQNTSDTAGGSLLPVMWSAYDFDDGTAPPTQTSVQVKAYCKQRVLNANRPFSVYLKPRVVKSLSEVDGTVDALASSERAPWINSTNNSVDHFGYKFWIDNWMGNTLEAPKCMLTIQPTYYLQLKDAQ